MAHSAEIVEEPEYSESARHNPNRFPFCFTRNILIRSDWRRLNREWIRKPLVHLTVFGALAFWIICSVAGSTHEKLNERWVYYPFAAFHVLLQFFIPLRSLALARSSLQSGRIEACLVTPIPHRHIFWWLWLRGFSHVAIVLAFYFPLYWVSGWLYGAGNPIEWGAEEILKSRPPKWPPLQPPSLAEIMCDMLVIWLLDLPWIKGIGLRIFLWALAFAGLCFLPRGDSAFLYYRVGGPLSTWFGHRTGPITPDIIYTASYIHLHALVTLLYFFAAAGYGAAVGVFVGLRRGLGSMGAAALVLFLGPGLELLVYMLTITKPRDLLGSIASFEILYTMLTFHIFSYGALWMGIKWNLLIYLSRRKIHQA